MLAQNDTGRNAADEVIPETLHRRRVPGDGDIDLPRLLRFLQDSGSPAPLGVEVFCEDLFSLPPEEVAVRCADGVRGVLARR